MNSLERINSKIVTQNSLHSLVKDWKDSKQKIVFTNGCFDILHFGHITYLFKAADFGTKLIIGLNSDSSVKKLKGKDRPISDQKSRALCLAALECVDAICIFNEETPINLINIVLPDFLIKGGDYKTESIVGYSKVTNNGGRVLTIPFVKGYSTSKILNKLFEF
ncbi:MAG TPA: D-glycero-beta-D-manno-heptose 1-phosphate adenylyltransferase [Bacteroidales bacterium]|nr:D-glycero-beta-D-manno-heptose 1-phosphate adenylyltransferase [Bacteroidales bacterium]